MRKARLHIRDILVMAMCIIAMLYANTSLARNQKRVLVITSYNPDTKKMYTALSDFSQELKRNGGQDIKVIIENMNCKGLSEAKEWNSRMANILNQHRQSPPDLIIPLGQEAWASFLSQKSDFARHTPVMPALVSTNTIAIDDSISNIRTYMPATVYYSDIHEYNIVGGIFYHYDIEKNLELTKKLFPQTKKIALVTDFTLGGLAMQSHVVSHMKRHKDIQLVLFDGRSNTVFSICNKLKAADKSNTVLWIGTWRIDSSENYSLTSTADVLQKANPQLPAISLSSVGMGNWSVAGYIPEYSAQGNILADLAKEYLHGEKHNLFHIIKSKYSFDMKELKNFHRENAKLPADAITLNTPYDFFEANRSIILTAIGIFLFLSVCLMLSVYYILKMQRMKNSLQKQSTELKKAKDAAERANNVKTSFIANMSHEIRTPLNAIVGFANLMGEDDYDKDEKQQFCHIIQENSNLLLNLINDILDISKIESGKLPICLEQCDVFDLCRTSMLSVKQARCQDNVEYIEDFPKEEKLIVTTDPIRLKQVIINLLTNASKYTRKGFIKLCIHPDYESGLITFAVTDTGCGIPEDKAEIVFERFVKLNQYVQGTGLGLSLSKVIIESMGGKIWVDTSYKEGARFVFTHPLDLHKIKTGGGKNLIIISTKHNDNTENYKKNKI